MNGVRQQKHTKVRKDEVPDRRSGSGRRQGEGKSSETKHEETKDETSAPKTHAEQRQETEPDRRHFLHKKIGGHKAA